MNDIKLFTANNNCGTLSHLSGFSAKGETTPPSQLWSKLSLALLSLLFIPLSFSCTSEASPDAYPELHQYYAESEGWATAVVGSDSIRRFQLKLGDYILQHPQAQESTLYPLIQQNIQQALLRVTIEVDDSWGEDRYITF